jgi:hypothetical protein
MYDLGVDAAMRCHFTAWDFAAIERSNQERPGAIKKLGGLLGCEFDLERHDRDRVALGHAAN